MKILLKIAYRARTDKCMENLIHTLDHVSDKENIFVVLSFDNDDKSFPEDMTRLILEQIKQKTGCQNIFPFWGDNKTKIQAINANINDFPLKWDILVQSADDMWSIPIWDLIIKEEFEKIGNTDCCLWFYDGLNNKICTLPIMGYEYYKQFDYIYHPSYRSLWCDNEMTEVAKSKGTMVFQNFVLFRHLHPSITGEQKDGLFIRNERFNSIDYGNYLKRKRKGFPK